MPSGSGARERWVGRSHGTVSRVSLERIRRDQLIWQRKRRDWPDEEHNQTAQGQQQQARAIDDEELTFVRCWRRLASGGSSSARTWSSMILVPLPSAVNNRLPSASTSPAPSCRANLRQSSGLYLDSCTSSSPQPRPRCAFPPTSPPLRLLHFVAAPAHSPRPRSTRA